jgi:hypothetical protein
MRVEIVLVVTSVAVFQPADAERSQAWAANQQDCSNHPIGTIFYRIGARSGNRHTS